MTNFDRALAALLWLLGVVFLAGIVHVLAIFYRPGHAAKDPMARLSVLAKPAQMTLLPRPAPGASFSPFADPAVVQGFCTFDLARGPLHLHGEVEKDRLLSFSFRTPEGLAFYSLSDRAAQQGKLDILLLSAAQLEELETGEDTDDEGARAQELRLVSPTPTGFVLVGALAEFQSEALLAEQRVKAVSCETEDSSAERGEP